MQENEFEKRVREEMGGLRLRPSGEVWDNVAAELKQKKRRRVVVFIFLLAGLSLIGTSGYFLWNNEKQNLTEEKTFIPANEKPINDKTIVKAPETKESTLPGQTKVKQQLSKDENKKIVEESKAATTDRVSENKSDITIRSTTENTTTRRDDIVNKTGTKQTVTDTKRKTSVADKEIVAAKKKTIPEKKMTIAPKDEDATISKQQLADDPTKVQKNAIAQNDIGIKQDSTATESIAAEKKDKTVTLKDSTAIAQLTKEENINKASKKKAGSSIQWGVDFSAGISNLGDNIFSLPSVAKSADQLYSTPGGVVNNPSNSAFYPPSSVKAGTAFKIGVIAEKQLTKKSSLVAGLQYAYLSNNIKTGLIKDTTLAVYDRNSAQSLSLNAVYSGKHETEYTNKYHLIALPVHYQWQLNKGKKLPILWNMGLSAGYLISSNALLYDTTAGGIHYRNKDAFNKVQLNLNTGLFFRLGAKKLQWSLGPELSMTTRRLLKDETQQKQYFLYGGLTGRLLFTKKK
jgi:hypothetical protein